ncbi:MAG: tetratricopeptide repeat protein, partial [Proteobacteria bacterium]|nr:tetratricopeptide repeat protein [Pseudomonadota bacterium]
EDRTSEDAEGFLDIADELRSALSDEFDPPREAAPQTAPVTFEEVFAQFKKGIEEVLGEEEYETHYNLGIAYKDMGLFDDALKEFEVAAREPGMKQDSLSLMAMCFLEKKDFDSAVKVAQRALEEASEPSKTGFFYQLGEAYAGNREWSKALAAYGEVKSRDPSFERIDDILQKIRSNAEKETPLEPEAESDSGPGMDEMLSDLIREVEEMARESTGKKEEQPKSDTGRDPKDRISYL